MVHAGTNLSFGLYDLDLDPFAGERGISDLCGDLKPVMEEGARLRTDGRMEISGGKGEIKAR